MNLRAVRYFLVAAEERNFTKAATRLGISQPSLSLAIRRLEQDLGGQLFLRDSRSLRLTKLGYAVKPGFLQIERSLKTLQKTVEDHVSKHAPSEAMAGADEVIE